MSHMLKVNLEPQFLEPEGFRWHSFQRQGRRIRFGSVFPKDSIPNAVVVCLGGLSEFTEKYFELAHDFTEQNLAFWIMDWMGQGKSDRYLKNPHKRHSQSFDEDIEDLHYFVLEYIKHSSVHPDKGRIPLALIGHSLGAHLGLRFLHKYPDLFECAALSAPFFGVKGLGILPSSLWVSISMMMSEFAGSSYILKHGDWKASQREPAGRDIFSYDPVRGSIHNTWCLSDPELQVGGVTYRWVYEALKSCKKLNRDLKDIQTPCALALAKDEKIVDNALIRRAAETMPNATLLELEGSRHEILMERDDVRNKFISAFYTLIKETIIDKPETLRPF